MATQRRRDSRHGRLHVARAGEGGSRSIDATDILAFGCVLYEMLTGRRAFRGDTVSDIIARVIDREPDWNALPATLASAHPRLLRRCLEKDPKKRRRHRRRAHRD